MSYYTDIVIWHGCEDAATLDDALVEFKGLERLSSHPSIIGGSLKRFDVELFKKTVKNIHYVRHDEVIIFIKGEDLEQPDLLIFDFDHKEFRVYSFQLGHAICAPCEARMTKHIDEINSNSFDQKLRYDAVTLSYEMEIQRLQKEIARVILLGRDKGLKI